MNTSEIKSSCQELVTLTSSWPSFTGLRIMMMPIVSCDVRTFPECIHPYQNLLIEAMSLFPQHIGKVVYVTIDEADLKQGQTHRRPGLHVDGIYRSTTNISGFGGSWGGGGGSWGGGYSVTKLHEEANGMILFANAPGCDVWTSEQNFNTFDFDNEGGAEHLRERITEKDGRFERMSLKPNVAYWLNPLCIHESMPASKDQLRHLIRISLPNNCPWFKGYTKNPLGVKPTGEILSERKEFMSWKRTLKTS